MAARFDAFELDPLRRQLSRGGDLLHLTPKAFDLLSLLVDAAPRVVAKAEIHQRLWPGGAVTDATLVGLVKEVRKALSGGRQEAIRTVHRVGYALDIDVTRTSAVTPRCHWLFAGNRRLALTDGENIIGREPGANIWLDHSTVSRRHARVTVSPTHTLIEDLGSKNGTSIGGVPLSGAAALSDGDEFTCGQLLITYRQSRADLPTATQAGYPEEPGDRR